MILNDKLVPDWLIICKRITWTWIPAWHGCWVEAVLAKDFWRRVWPEVNICGHWIVRWHDCGHMIRLKSCDWTIRFEGFTKNILSYVKSKSVVIWSIYPSCITTLVALGIRLGVITDKWAEWSRLEMICENILFEEVNEADRDSFCFWKIRLSHWINFEGLKMTSVLSVNSHGTSLQ